MTGLGARRRTRGDESGIMALATAVVVSGVLFFTGMLAFQVAGTNQGNSSLERIQTFALSAAEGGLDRSYQDMQSATTASQLPCGPLTENLGTAPATSSYSATISYYSTFPPSGSALSCSAVQQGTATAASAEIISTGTTGSGTSLSTNQYMEALVEISVGTVTGSVFDQALFSGQSLTGSGNPSISGYVGDDADVYTNGNVACGSNWALEGSVTAQGTFTGTGNCTVDGSVTAVGDVTLGSNTSIGGNVTSTGNSGCSSVGNVSMSSNAVVDQSGYAYCSISLSGNAKITHSDVPNDTTLTNPPVESFPAVPMPSTASVAALWTAAGYTSQITNNTCSGSNDVYTAISNMSTATAPTVIMTSCALSWSGISTISINQNLAIFSTGGFTTSGITTFESATSTTHQLFLMVPSVVGSTQTTCSNGQPGITIGSDTAFNSTVDVMDYTPCTIDISGNTTGSGQVYGGQTIDASQNFTATYYPLVVPGATGGGQVVGSTTMSVVYERQLSSLADA